MRNYLIAAFLILLCLVPGCKFPNPNSSTPLFTKENAFQIYIGEWDKTVTDPEGNLGYTLDSSWPLLKKWYLTNSSFSITLSNIEKYDWDKQELLLTPKASHDFESKFNYPHVSLVFVVTVNQEPKYGGMFMFRQSSMGISFPVIYIDHVNNQIKFTIRPTHNIFDHYEPGQDWYGINDPLIKKIFSQVEKLH